jgi:hypothetical protein
VESRKPEPDPPDPDPSGTPWTLIAFASATLIVVGAVALLARTDDAWGVVFAMALLIALLAIVLWVLEIDLRGPSVAVRRSRARRGRARPDIPQAWSGPPAERRVLLVASEPVDEARLSCILDGARASTAVLVIAPALHRTRLRYWVSDSDEAIEHARGVQEATVRALQRENVPSSGHVGSPDPLAAIADALRFFDADRIALALHTRGPHRYRERDLRAEVEHRFERPVIALEPRAA